MMAKLLDIVIVRYKVRLNSRYEPHTRDYFEKKFYQNPSRENN